MHPQKCFLLDYSHPLEFCCQYHLDISQLHILEVMSTLDFHFYLCIYYFCRPLLSRMEDPQGWILVSEVSRTVPETW